MVAVTVAEVKPTNLSVSSKELQSCTNIIW